MEKHRKEQKNVSRVFPAPGVPEYDDLYFPYYTENVRAERERARYDPQGSWTGVPRDKNELPVQDADDL